MVGSIHNVKPTLTDKKLSLEVYGDAENSQTKKLSIPVDLVGYTCMEHDCLYPDYPHEIGIGDYAVFDNLGAFFHNHPKESKAVSLSSKKHFLVSNKTERV